MQSNPKPTAQGPKLPNTKPPRSIRFLSIFVPILFLFEGLYTFLKLHLVAWPLYHYLNGAIALLMLVLTIRIVYVLRHNLVSINYLTSFFSLLSILWITLYTPMWMAIVGLAIALCSILYQSFKNHMIPFRRSASYRIGFFDYFFTIIPLILIIIFWTFRLLNY